MVGNSVRSDVLPVLEIGGHAVHIPYHVTWAHEHVDHDGTVPTLDTIAALPAWLATQA
jgi:putative hydrolase of the HAD superfamily